MKGILIALSILVLLVGMFFYFRWSSAIRQPLNFSHSQHVRASIDCATCHKQAQLDSLPEVALCKTCHNNLTFPQNVQWVRVYRVAPDIIFSHAHHSQDSCKICHESLANGQRWIHESRFTMDFCMKCHEQRHANNACGACHTHR